MTQAETIKAQLTDSIAGTASKISDYVTRPGKDMTRKRKLPVDSLLRYLVSQGSSSTRNELLDFTGMDAGRPTPSALNQQRAKLSPDAVESVFDAFNSHIRPVALIDNYRFLAADGSTLTYFSAPKWSGDEYHTDRGDAHKGSYSMHLNAIYDLSTRTYTDAFIQPEREHDEYSAFCTMVDRHPPADGMKTVFTGDRGYCSYNNMAHVTEAGQHFLFRAKDIGSKGLVHNFDLPSGGSFDRDISVTLVRTQSKKVTGRLEGYVRYVDGNTAFDYIECGSSDTYALSFRVVRFPISEKDYECVLTNLPREDFPPDRIKAAYNARWGVETSFRKLKYTIGLSNFHSCKPDFIKQEIWAKLIAYNVTEMLVNSVVINNEGSNKHGYKVNFSSAAHICRVFLRQLQEEDPIDVAELLLRELIPIRDGRQYDRLVTAHFRKPRYFIYRAS